VIQLDNAKQDPPTRSGQDTNLPDDLRNVVCFGTALGEARLFDWLDHYIGFGREDDV
jgi:hypothetical protein